MITGTEYYCRLARISKQKLINRTGLSRVVVQDLFSGRKAMKRSALQYMRVAEALDVTIDQLLQRYDESELGDGDRASFPSRTEDLRNCVAVYRRKKGLTYAQLGERLGGKTRACGHEACIGEHPRKKHVKVLAAYEGITPEEFCKLYASDTEV